MVSKAEIKDKDKQVFGALQVLGYSITTKDVEKIMNVIDFIRESKTDVTMKDITQLGEMVESLYKD